MKTETAKTDHASLARDFISSLHGDGWIGLTAWEDAGHIFEMLTKRETHRKVIVQIYPGGNGFEVWRPVTDANNIDETLKAVQEYGA